MESIDIFLQSNAYKDKNISEQKKLLRKFLYAKRKEQFKLLGDTKFWGEKQFFATLKKLNIASPEELQNKFRVACFFPVNCELNFLPFAQSDWLMPFVFGDQLRWFEYGDGKNNYTLNKWQIPEKHEKFCFEYEPSEKQLLCFVPGLAGDSQNHRLGYGQGYYDRFLGSKQNIFSVLCLPSKTFFFDKLPCENFDVPVSLVVY